MTEGMVYAVTAQDGEVKYVGFTTATLEFRLSMLRSQKGRDPVLQWIQSLGDRRWELGILPLWKCVKQDSKDWVRRFVAYYGSHGCALLNGNCVPRSRRGVGSAIVEQTTYIYVLRHPETNEVRYVGKTVDLKDRMKGHKQLGRTRCDNWKRALAAFGLLPTFEVVETVQPGKNWKERECYWIKHYREAGADLTNLTDGGEGHLGQVKSPETLAKMRALYLGRAIPPEQRALISRSLTGKKQSPETVAKRKATINANRIAAGLDPWNFDAGPAGVLATQRKWQQKKARASGSPIRYSPEWVKKRLDSFNATVAKLTPQQRSQRAAHLNETPIRYWKGKKRGPMSQEWRDKIRASMLRTMRTKYGA